MANRTESNKTWQATRAYGLAIACLFVGVAAGYVGHGRMRDSNAGRDILGSQPALNRIKVNESAMPSLEQLKSMADKKAEPLLKQLKTQPNNAVLLAQIAHTYLTAHQFKEAETYYERSLRADSNSVGVRADYASCLYYNGEVDKSIVALEQALSYEPSNSQVLFNLGMIRWQGKGDSAGAIELWQRLLKSNPTLPSDRQQAVQKAIAEAQQAPKPFGK